jgi:hypothetical protein
MSTRIRIVVPFCGTPHGSHASLGIPRLHRGCHAEEGRFFADLAPSEAADVRTVVREELLEPGNI